VRTPGTQGSERPSPGVRLPFRVLPRSRRPHRSSVPSAEATGTSRQRGIRLPGFLLPRTRLRRVPLFRPTTPKRRVVDEGLPSPRRVPSSGFLPPSTVLAALHDAAFLLRGPPEVMTPRRFAALFHAARVPGVALQSFFPLEEPYPLSRASCFLAGSRSTAATRSVFGAFTTAFRVQPTLCRGSPLRACRTPGPRRRFLATAEAIRRARREARRPQPSIPSTPGPPVGGRHARFEALLPS